MESSRVTGAEFVHKLRNKGSLMREDFSSVPVSFDEIENGLYLGNLTAATHMETLKSFKITHILTLDSVPLPQHIVEASFLTTKYIHIADMAKEDILHHLDQCVNFIRSALEKKENILVHCYFGVSRSSSAVIAYIMKQYNVDYEEAFDLVKSKRRFVQPNSGFVAQLKLYHRMGCKIDPQYQKYKIYCLRLAGDQVRKVKILPQCFHNLIKPDPAIARENPEPIGYRCRKCRRLVAAKSHIFIHNMKNHESSEYQTTKSMNNALVPASTSSSSTRKFSGMPRLLDQIAVEIQSLGSPVCKHIIFIEPIAWMRNVTNSAQGRLNCPKCEQKLGSFSWVNGCQCLCGMEVSPAFYLIPSKVELSKAVQNVQTTI